MGKPAKPDRSDVLARLASSLIVTPHPWAEAVTSLKLSQIRIIHELSPDRSTSDPAGKCTISGLVRVFKNNEGEPLGETTVGVTQQAGGARTYFYIDGAHRGEALRRAFGDKEIPVRVFYGALPEVLMEMGRLNRTLQRNSTDSEKAERLWLIEAAAPYKYSKKQLVEALDVSGSTIANQRRLGKEFLRAHPLMKLTDVSWKDVQWWKRTGALPDENDPEVRRAAQAKKDGEGLRKIFGAPERADPARVVRALRAMYSHWNGEIEDMPLQDEDGESKSLPFPEPDDGLPADF